MPPAFHAQLITPRQVLFDGQVQALVVPGSDGYFGILANHAPLMADMEIGEVVITLPDGERRYFAVAGGVCEVRDNEVVLLAEVGEMAQDIDGARAQTAAERARHRLRGEGAEKDIDVVRARLALVRALNRLKVSSEVAS